ncbi:MAG TPA: response regulator [Kiritimatiellia bacterium]|nr:response regulator [Kiritimatiellia bacterium]HMP00001.1 response regulator [Kiritimatiellia bacterium]HMP97392.1 response regulator [Kiritimatiellia bacterium]
MNRIVILCVEDEAEVREAILRDLAPFKPQMRVEAAEDVDDARAVLRECAQDDDPVGLVLCDHLMPGVRGVDFLIELMKDPAYEATRKVLLTGQAGLEDTIRAVNEARLHHYIAKPWRAEELLQVVRNQLTEYVLSTQEDLMPFIAQLDGPRLLEAIAAGKRG